MAGSGTGGETTRRCIIPTYKQLPRGKQKQHDEFRDWTFHALVWVKNNWQTALELVAIGISAIPKK